MTRDVVVVERTIAAPPHDVWPYLSRGELWSLWQGERCVIQPVPGGEFRVEMPDGAAATGRVIEVTKNERLVFTWGWTDAPFQLPPGSTTVEITLEPVAPNSTRLALTHRDLPDDLAEHHVGGWEQCLSTLVELAASEAAAPD